MQQIRIPEPGQFRTKEEESFFWADPDISECTKHNGELPHSSNGIIRAFKDGEADLIVYCTDMRSSFYGMRCYVLREEYAVYRARVRQLTIDLHPALINKPIGIFA